DPAIKFFCPDVGATVRFDQLGGDAHCPIDPSDASFKRIPDTKCLGRFSDIIGAVLVDEGRVSGDDRKGLEARERSCQVLDNAVGKVTLLRIVTEVGEGKNGDRRLAVERADFY